MTTSTENSLGGSPLAGIGGRGDTLAALRPPVSRLSPGAKAADTDAAGPKVRRRGTPLWVRILGWTTSLAIMGGIGGAAWLETQTSGFESALLARVGRDLRFSVYPGPTTAVRYPTGGPYDERLGYTQMPSFLERLTAGPYRVTAQARMSPTLLDYLDLSFYPPYAEKTSAGLQVLDRGGTLLYGASYPERVFTSFASVPPLVADTLLFIENRKLLDPAHPYRNPAVDWDRFGLALLQIPLQVINPGAQRIGGSTLATQTEKYRHSAGGQTADGVEKLRQMASASMRAYMDGADTTQTRFRILVDYLNSTPLSARPGIGEINGLGDGLWAWYGTDFATANQILRDQPRTEEDLATQAVVYKQVLSLLLAQRRPSFYLTANRTALDALCNEHLRVLEKAGVIPPALADAAQNFQLRFREEAPDPPDVSYVEQKAVNAIRNRLISMLGAHTLYQLDRLDLTTDTTLDQAAQERVTAVLKRLADPAATAELGLTGDRLLTGADPAKVVYSVTLYERAPHANLVRVQVDTLDQPLDLNEGARLDLGSTAKLRTLISYLEIIEKLYRDYHQRDAAALRDISAAADDNLTRWVTQTLAQTGDQGLPALLNAAMERTYSAGTGERFFTGGGLHSFNNFEKSDDHRILTVSEALRRSVNLVFIRLMRDVVNHYIAEGPARKDDVLDDPRNPARQTYLAQFADREGSTFLNHFWDEYGGLNPDQALEKLAAKAGTREERLAVIYRSVRPNSTPEDLARFLAAHGATENETRAPGAHVNAKPQPLKPATVAALFEKADPEKWTLNDRGYMAGVHPLELWLVAYLQESPKAPKRQMLKESSSSRQESYQWLFSTRYKHAQDTRIGIVLEEQAFARIHADWKRLGYPFEALVPSYATAIGSSGDRPGALADLMGIIVNDGIRLPTARITRLHFAAGTPYEATVGLDDRLKGERVLSHELVDVVKAHLLDVVQNGTAQRAKGAFHDAEGNPLPLGGKTGTGDQRFDRFGPGGVLLESRVVNRTATFVFYAGDRFFGVITAHVHGAQAANYHFTSALPAQLLRVLAPALQPLMLMPPDQG
ncbi:transglycosylase domain-containing protein [Nitrospirillum pindoramense]|uniref:peptidoglycan glycosyltransferase n=1 Tax=Nitrospirillum amazonense TaxID=28077 RepID=A0A560GPE4_9PROT|nr:transglycosylase domain-containing protein [Nitrospirillum amazonense]TWB35862.1 membrane peptidoglycan carboxypeptidase [Nitrospirillum amazonense]